MYNILLKVDLQTLSRNLDRGVYATKGEFYADVQLMFDNEVLFNKGAESEWIAQLATRMEHMFIQLKKMYDVFCRYRSKTWSILINCSNK